MISVFKQNASLRRRYEELLARRKVLASPVFSRERQDLKKYRSVVLAKDPMAQGMLTINEKLADIQANRDWVSGIVAEVSSVASEWRAYMEDVEDLYEDVVDLLMWQDPEVKRARNQNLRLALARVKCPEVINLFGEARRRYFMVAGFEKECRDALDNLDRANANASRQVTVIQLSMELNEISRGAEPRGLVVRRAR